MCPILNTKELLVASYHGRVADNAKKFIEYVTAAVFHFWYTLLACSDSIHNSACIISVKNKYTILINMLQLLIISRILFAPCPEFAQNLQQLLTKQYNILV